MNQQVLRVQWSQPSSNLFATFADMAPSCCKPTNTPTSTINQSRTSSLNNEPISTLNIFKDNNNTTTSDSQLEIVVPTAGDRFIPRRAFLKKESLITSEDSTSLMEKEAASGGQENGLAVSDLYRLLVMTESPLKKSNKLIQSFENNNILKFNQKSQSCPGTAFGETPLGWTEGVEQKEGKPRKINKLPVKVLDAPTLQDDYYLNLLDWGNQNFMAVGLSSNVYIWNATNAKVHKLCDLGSSMVTGVGWAPKDPLLAVGSESGETHIWDIERMKKLRTLSGHANRVGAISWSSQLLATGSRDRTIMSWDTRANHQLVAKLQGHKQEVCGLRWSPDQQHLCSGGNDNKLLVWSPKTTEPVLRFLDHKAAVKAMAWSPQQHGMLVSGGGTADRTIRFRNTLTGETTKVTEVGSQVCALMFSKVSQQLVSTHGYQNHQINIWTVPGMQKVATLTGHHSRVLYLAMSKDGSTIVTGAGDETLRFWNVFPKKRELKRIGSLNQNDICLR